MANNIVLTAKFLKALDEVYKVNAKSSILETNSALAQATADSNEFKIAKIAMDGLGDYSKEDGYNNGDVTLEWETKKFENNRDRSFTVDSMDDLESLGIVTATLMGEFIRTKVIPEVDAYRFAKYATAAGKKVAATLTKDTVEDAIEAGIVEMQENEIDTDGAVCFITPTVLGLLRKAVKRDVSNGVLNVNDGIETYNGLRLVKVPQNRFYTQVTLQDGRSSGQVTGGFIKTTTTGKDQNFLILDPKAVIQITKHAKMREFSPEINQKADAWKFVYRLYHDAFTLDNKVKGIYSHHKA